MSDTRNFIPLNIQKKLAELKSHLSKGGPTAPADSSPDVVQQWVDDQCCAVQVMTPGVHGDFRVPTGRASGNQLFRRYSDGTLDIDAAKDVVVDVIIKLKHGVQPLTDLEKLVLTLHFPSVFNFYDPLVAAKMAAHHLNLSMHEKMMISAKVAQVLQDSMESLISGTGVSS